MKKIILFSCLATLAACSDNDDDNTVVVIPEANARFEVTTVNLTVAQPFSPIALMLHSDSVKAFTIGQPASPGLELLAEAGDNSQFLSDTDSFTELSADAPLGPGASETHTLELETSETAGVQLTVLTMLVNTNDAITAVNGVDISALNVGDSMTFNTLSYDTGTEANSELAIHIPGPAGNGEGFNNTRDDINDQVTMHAGVVSSDDGLSQSDLSQQHKWDNPVARVTITRSQ